NQSVHREATASTLRASAELNAAAIQEPHLLLAISPADKIHHLLQLRVLGGLKKPRDTQTRLQHGLHIMRSQQNPPPKHHHLATLHHLDDRVLTVLARHRQTRLRTRHTPLSVPAHRMIQEKLLPWVRLQAVPLRQESSVVRLRRME